MSGPSALITGSTRGIGLRIARTLAAIPNMNIMLHSNLITAESPSKIYRGVHDANVHYLSDAGYSSSSTKEEAIEAAMASVRQSFRGGVGGGQRVLHTAADLSSPNEAAGIVNAAIGAFGRLDILINNAAILPEECSVEFTPDDVWERVLAVNLSAPFHCIKACLPTMKRQKFGRIINVGCALGSPVSAPNNAAFVAAKHGLVGLSKSVALELATVEGGNLTCNTVTPGLVSGSGMFRQKALERADREGITLNSAEEALIMEVCPSGHAVSPEAVAAACAYLAMPASSSTNGANLVIDGGWSTQ